MIIVKPKIITGTNRPNTARVLKPFFIFIQSVFFLDFGFIQYRSKRHKLTVKFCLFLFSILIAVASSFKVINDLQLVYIIWNIKYIIETFYYVLIFLFAPEHKSFYKFLVHLHRIDLRLRADNTPFYFEIKILASFLASFVYKISINIVYCTRYQECFNNVLFQIIYSIPVLSIDLPLIVLHFVFYAAYMRLISLKKFIQDTNKPSQGQILYKSLVDSTENIKQSFDPIIVFALSMHIPSLMVIIYETIKYTRIKDFNADLFGYVLQITTAFVLIFTIFAPTVAASSLTSQACEIKLILHNKLLEEKDEQQQRDIQRFINYIEARPFKFTVLRVIRLDATLPVVLLNVCVTYLIVLLQFTHFY